MAKSAVRPHIFDDAVIHKLVKGDVFKFVGLGRMKNWIVFCESREDWF